MTSPVLLRMTGRQHKVLQKHLYPGDGKEAVAILLAGRRSALTKNVLCVRELILIPHEECYERSCDLVKWPTSRLEERLEEASKRNWAVIKVHSHPNGFEEFSWRDDSSDTELFTSIYGWMNTDVPHASMVMLPNGKLFGRAVFVNNVFSVLHSICIAGDDIEFWFCENDTVIEHEAFLRNQQAYGSGTTNLLRNLRVGVVGCSGTGSPVIEQLARLGVGTLVLVDPKRINEKNLNRILNSTREDVRNSRYKVDILEHSIQALELNTTVIAIADDIHTPEVVRELALCDVIFGCMDTMQGRQILNRIAAFYCIPYFDVGVRLVADGENGISHICGTVHYLQPDGSSLLSRGLITQEGLRAESLHKNNPEEYARLHGEGYITGVAEERPAVLPVNMLYASLAVNEFLARIHPYRHEPNSDYSKVMVSLEQMRFYLEDDGTPCLALASCTGKGDVTPLLNMPSMSE